jgi:hypothetical protein
MKTGLAHFRHFLVVLESFEFCCARDNLRGQKSTVFFKNAKSKESTEKKDCPPGLRLLRKLQGECSLFTFVYIKIFIMLFHTL